MEKAKASNESYRDLLVWQKSVDLVEVCYRFTALLPKEEKSGLSSHIQRSAVSVPANIAEGSGRRNIGEYIHHLLIANGSVKELETHLIIAGRIGHVKVEAVQPITGKAEEIGRMLAGLILAWSAHGISGESSFDLTAPCSPPLPPFSIISPIAEYTPPIPGHPNSAGRQFCG